MSSKFDVTRATTFLQTFFFQKFEFTFLDHFRVNLLMLITSRSILAILEGFGKSQEIQDGGSKMVAHVREQAVIVTSYDVIS